jgi:AraC-like DNA-binding protein
MTTNSKVSTIEKSPFVARVSFLQVDHVSETLATPDGTWDLVFIQNAGGIRAIRSGLTTRPVRLFHSEGEQILAISFKPSVNMVTVDDVASLDRGYLLESDRKKFVVAGEVFEIPTFNNADVFVDRLARAGLLRANRAVQSILDGQSVAISERTLQRQFKLTTGMTHKHFTMIERAALAAERLRKGESAQNVVHALGFYDQAHLINSLRKIIGQTPSQLDRDTTL